MLLGLAFGLQASAAEPAGATGKPCCVVTAIDARTGLVTAKVRATGKTFQFKADAAARRSLKVGSAVFANFKTNQISLDGKKACCQIVAARRVRPAEPAGARTMEGLTQLNSIALSSSSVVGGVTVSGTVVLNRAAGSSGVTVKFQSSQPAIAAVPQDVVVQPGATVATFVIQTYPVVANPNVVSGPAVAKISGQIGSATPKTANLTVLAPTLTSVAITPASVPGGSAASGEVRISGPAPSGGVTFSLSAKVSGAEPPLRTELLSITRSGPVISVAPSVTVPAGATSATFPVTTKAVAQSTPALVTASYGPFINKTATLTLIPPTVSAVTLNPTHPIGGSSSTGTVSLTGAAPAGGVALSISTSGSGCGPAPTVPASASIPGGSPSATFPITTQPGGGSWTIRISGRSAELYIRHDILATNALVIPATLKGGTTAQGKVQLQGVAGPTNCGGNSFKLESSGPLYAQVPESVFIAPGAGSATFPITTSAVISSQTITITVYGNVGYGFASRQATMTVTP